MDQCRLLADIKAPVIMVVGANDQACPVSWVQVLHDGIAGSRLVVSDNADYLLNIEEKDELNSALMSLLKERAR